MKIYNLNGLSLGVAFSITYKEQHAKTGVRYTNISLLPSIDISIMDNPDESSSLFVDIQIGWMFFVIRIHYDNCLLSKPRKPEL